MDCACQVSSCGYNDWEEEPAIKLTDSKRNYTCCECGRIISAGENYEYFYGILDGEQHCFRTCSDCLSMRNGIFCDWTFEHIWEDLEMELDMGLNGGMVVPESCLSEMTKTARDRVCELIEKYWGD